MRSAETDSDVEEADVLGVALDERASGLDVLAYEDREQVVGLGCVVEGDLAEDPVLLVHRGHAKLLGVHLAEALEALDRVLADALAALPAHLDQRVALAVRVGVLDVVPAPLDLVQRGAGEVYGPGLDQRPHEAEEEGQQ